jgi:hypothetical protein
VPDDRVATIEGSSVADGATASLTYEDNEAHTIEKIQVVEEAGTTLDASTATLSIKGDSFTDQNIVLSALQGDYTDLYPFDVELPANTEFELSFTNDNGSSVTINVVLYFALEG